MFFSLAHLGALLLQYKYWILLPIAILEGPIITIIAGAAISFGYLGWWPSIVIISAGDIIGDVGHYYIGDWGGEPFIRRWGKYLGIKEKHVVSLENILNGHPGKSLLLGKLAHGVGGALLIAAGLVKMPMGKFLYWNTVGTIPKTIGLLVVGFYFVNAITNINSILDVVASATVIIVVVAIFVWLHFYQKKTEIK